MKWIPCHKCCDYAFVDEGDHGRNGVCDLRFQSTSSPPWKGLLRGIVANCFASLIGVSVNEERCPRGRRKALTRLSLGGGVRSQILGRGIRPSPSKGKQLPRRGVRAFRFPQKFGGVQTLASRAGEPVEQRLLCGHRERGWHWRCHQLCQNFLRNPRRIPGTP